ncbi:FecCD family ABC transporter permease [Paenisporosarcina cavernae]|uniref:Iron ABC transporter permease n=1 Tax=Paenisporosarcina cavernae TaxID=2320858 RepID=A0A385YVF7_9BACL|nr:iron ABC transporter permease [Paenisporosarcina cavernae]AYC30461.1 iron ABC transporter permease [Paenisporosarcina cavernae]
MGRKFIAFFQQRSPKVSIMSVFLLVLIVSILSAGSGEFVISPIRVIQGLLGYGDELDQIILLDFRLPRIVMAIFVGMGLAVAGAILQGITKNPLASPDLIGITAGASFAVVLFLTLFSDSNNALTVSIQWLPLFAFVGATVTAILVFLLSWKNGIAPFRMLLIGIAVAAFMQAGTTVWMLLGPIYQASQATIWTTGSIYGANWSQNLILVPWVAIFITLSLLLHRQMNILALGDDIAAGVGSKVQLNRIILLLLSTALTGISVSFAGGIGFVGLIAPHIARRIVGPKFVPLAIFSAGIGALLVVIADWIARVAFAPTEVPAGIWTAAVGAPYFIYLLIKQRK